MAGDWIKMRTALAHDPAVIAMAIDLNKNEFEIVGMLHHVWSWADSQSQDGHIKRVTKVWLDRFVHCDGFAKSMASVNWLVLSSDGIEFPNFGKHNGESAKKRAEAAERQRLSRELKALNDEASLSQKTCDKPVTREEKRREDKDQEQPPLSPKGEKPEAKAEPEPKPKRKTKIPEPFMLSGEMRAWAVENVPAVTVKTETENFVDYWRGSGGTKLDWVATWRNWMRKAQKDAERAGRGGFKPFNKQQDIEDSNNRVVQEVMERERLRKEAEVNPEFVGGDEPITLEGEFVHAH